MHVLGHFPAGIDPDLDLEDVALAIEAVALPPQWIVDQFAHDAVLLSVTL
jgi:hypothetical protein